MSDDVYVAPEAPSKKNPLVLILIAILVGLPMLVVIIAVVIIAALTVLGQNLESQFESVADQVGQEP